MRDRGIAKPELKAWIAAAIAVGAAVNLSVNAPTDLPAQSNPAWTMWSWIIVVIAILTASNFAYAARLMHKIRRGERNVAKWVVDQETLARFINEETAMKSRRNNWKIPRAAGANGLEVIFAENAVLVGDTYFTLRTKGVSRFAWVRFHQGCPSSVEFATRVSGAAPMGNYVQKFRYNGHLRVPIADDAQVEAARAIAYFSSLP
jgi:hypothetical protein